MSSTNVITIKKIENSKRDFVAYIKNDFLRATYSVCFEDTVFGAVALTKFYEMIKSKFNDNNLTIKIDDAGIHFKHDDLLQLMTTRRT